MRAELLRVLQQLDDDQWQRPTACEGWSVRDVALHILADDMGYLSRHRDRDGITIVTDSWDELIAQINAQNELWVQATRRISRRLLLSLLTFTGTQFQKYLATLDPAQGEYRIAWAGNRPVPMWLQIARELTEYWMHHQHICEAAGVESLKERRFLHPVLSTFVHALPRTYQQVEAAVDTAVKFSVNGAAADSWYIVCEAPGWRLYANTEIAPAATVTMPGDVAWRLFTKGISPEEAAQHTTITGDVALGQVALQTVSILA